MIITGKRVIIAGKI